MCVFMRTGVTGGGSRCHEISAGYIREAGFELSQVTCRSSDPASQLSPAVYNNIIEYAIIK